MSLSVATPTFLFIPQNAVPYQRLSLLPQRSSLARYLTPLITSHMLRQPTRPRICSTSCRAMHPTRRASLVQGSSPHSLDGRDIVTGMNPLGRAGVSSLLVCPLSRHAPVAR
jgi:hypothetical protein